MINVQLTMFFFVLMFQFTQNMNLWSVLKSTQGKPLAESSPYDRRWGIGMTSKDSRATNPCQWKGQNWMGELLTELREELLEEGY